MASPTRFLKDAPKEQTVIFAGEFIDISQMADELELNLSYLSHIFSARSRKLPSTKYGMVLAEALGMEYPDFIEQLLQKKNSE